MQELYVRLHEIIAFLAARRVHYRYIQYPYVETRVYIWMVKLLFRAVLHECFVFANFFVWTLENSGIWDTVTCIPFKDLFPTKVNQHSSESIVIFVHRPIKH